MFRLSKRKRRFIRGLLTAVAIGLVSCLGFHFNLLHEIHLQSSDFLYRASDSNPRADPDNKIVIVAIDDKSLDQLGHFSSWPRAYHSQLIAALAKTGARIIVFDILFSEPTADDEEMATSIKQAGNVILPLAGNLEAPQSGIAGETIALESAIRPLQAYEESTLAVGYANMMPDEDGIVRRLPLIIQNGNAYEPALSLSAVAKYLRRPQIIESIPKDNYLSFAGRTIPLDNANSMLINYKGGSASASNFVTVSYVDVLKNNVSPDTFQDKIVLIGATAIGLGDTFWTPMGRIMSGVELHASAMDTILAGNFLKTSPAAVTVLSILLLAFLCGLAVLRLRVLWATLITICLALIYFLTAFYFFDHGTLLDMLYPPLAIAGTFMGITLYNVTSERLEKSEITKTFGQYVSPSIAKTILDAIDQGSLKLGGEERTVTILFADARNFTGISEKMNTQELVSILNRYLSVIIKATLQYDGMVNKFGGDSIMAVWNTPIACQGHALSATRAAVRTQQALKELQERTKNLPRMEFGIGINTGKAVAGNMGSTDRLEYSVIGDAVNTAARLAGATPGGKVWVGSSTFDLIHDDVFAIPLKPLSLRGKREAIRVYEVLDIQPLPSVEQASTINLIPEGRV
jgi:adenylate cyclase